MGTVDKQGVVTMQELLVSSLAQSDALSMGLDAKNKGEVQWQTRAIRRMN